MKATTEDLSLFLKVTSGMYVTCAKDAAIGLVRNWKLLAGSVLAYLIYFFCGMLLSPFGIGGGFLLGFISIALLSLYYSWVSDTIQKERLSWKAMIDFDYGLFFSFIGVAFIISIVEYLVHHLIQGLNADWIQLALRFGIVIVFNAIPEIIYIRRYESLQALSEAAGFTIRNWIEWYFPILVIMIPVIYASARPLVVTIGTLYPLMPAEIMLSVPSHIFPGTVVLGIILGLILANWYVLFRGHLFQDLETGTRRRRMFAMKQR